MRRALPLLALLLAAGCGGGHSQPADAEPAPDAPRPDAGACSGDIAWEDGGNLFVEYLTLDSELQGRYALPGGITTMARVLAVFVRDSTPEHATLPTPGQCENLTTAMGWPVYIGSPRIELDLGALSLHGANTAGTTATTTIPELMDSTDALGRAQDYYYQLVQPDASSLLAPDSAYTVSFAGTMTIPNGTFSQDVFVPAMFQVSQPDLEDDGPLVAGTDYRVYWTPTTSMNLPAGMDELAFVWLLDTSGAPLFLCIADRATGSFTIPGQTIADYKQVAQMRGMPANQVILRRDALVHERMRLPAVEPTNCRQLDLLGVTSFEQLMNVN